MNMKIQFSRIFTLAALTILLVVPVFVFTALSSRAALNIVDGDLVTVSPNPDIYIVKITGVKKFKRLILNPDIFNSYGHLKWSNVKTIDQATLDSYKLSELVIEINPDGSVADPKVYRVVSAANSDIGERSWLNLTASEFEAAGYDWDSLYKVNHKEALPSFYPTKTPLTYQDVLSIKNTLFSPQVNLPPVTTPTATTSADILSPRYITTEGGAVYDTVLKKFISPAPSSQTTTTTQSSTILVGSISLSASPVIIPADGKSTSIITATVKDTGNNVAPNQTVYFSYGNVTVAAVTNANGVANIAYIADTNAGIVTITASLGKITGSSQIKQVAVTELSVREGGVTGSSEQFGVILAGFAFSTNAITERGEKVLIKKLVVRQNAEMLGNFYNFKLTDDKYNLISSTEIVGNPIIFDLSNNPITINYQPSCYPGCVAEQWFYVLAQLTDYAENKVADISIYNSSDMEVFGEATGSVINMNSKTILPTTGYSHKFIKRSDGGWQAIAY